MNVKDKSKKKTKEIIGYALGDFGSCLLFGLVQSVLQKYYTDVLRIDVIAIMTMMVLARIWDAVNDIICGKLIDARPFGGTDKYRVWIKIFAIPVAVSACLMFVRIPGLSTGGYLAYAYVTYILFGMLYTCVNIPYGTLAYSMNKTGHSNMNLSVARSVGSVFGAVPAMLLISFSYVLVDGKKVMSYDKVMTGVFAISILAAIMLYLTYKLTREGENGDDIFMAKGTVKDTGDGNMKGIVRDIVRSTGREKTHAHAISLLRSRPYVSVCIVGMLFLAAQMFEQAYNAYLFDYYFQRPQLTMLPTICQYLPAGIMIIFIPKLTGKFSTKQICSSGLLFAAVCNSILFVFFPKNIGLYIGFQFLSGFGTACIFLLLWAMVNETFKYNENNLGFYDHATAYAIFLFMRKIGQSIEAVLVNASLSSIGYVDNVLDVENISAETLQAMFRDSVLIPAILFGIAALVLSLKWRNSEE